MYYKTSFCHWYESVQVLLSRFRYQIVLLVKRFNTVIKLKKRKLIKWHISWNMSHCVLNSLVITSKSPSLFYSRWDNKTKSFFSRFIQNKQKRYKTIIRSITVSSSLGVKVRIRSRMFLSTLSSVSREDFSDTKKKEEVSPGWFIPTLRDLIVKSFTPSTQEPHEFWENPADNSVLIKILYYYDSTINRKRNTNANKTTTLSTPHIVKTVYLVPSKWLR